MKNIFSKQIQKIKRMLTLGIVSFFAFIFIILLVTTGVGASGSPSTIMEDYTNGLGVQDRKEIYDVVIKEIQDEKKYTVFFYELSWYFNYVQERPTKEEVKYIGNWIADHNPDSLALATWFKNESKFKSKLTKSTVKELKEFIDNFQEIEYALQGESTEGGNGGTTIDGVKDADFNSPWYRSPVNPSASNGYMGQCTWYAWGRANEVFKGAYARKPAGNARDWILQWNEPSGRSPKKYSIAVWGGSMQHVAFVENVEGDVITITEGNYNSKKDCWNWGCDLNDAVSFTNTWSGTLAELQKRQGSGGKFLGFIYLK